MNVTSTTNLSPPLVLFADEGSGATLLDLSLPLSPSEKNNKGGKELVCMLNRLI